MSVLDLAADVVQQAQKRGAEQATAVVSESTHASIQRRAGQIEHATEANTRGLELSVLVDDRYVSSTTSDLRPEALNDFVRRCLDAAQHLEPDPCRRLPDPGLCGRGVSEHELDQDDPAWQATTPALREQQASAIESIVLDGGGEALVSCTAHVADGRSHAARVDTNGFSDQTAGAWFSAGAEVTFADGEARPEAYAFYAARHRADLPSDTDIGQKTLERIRARKGSKPIASGNYTMIVDHHTAGQLLGVLAGPLSGGALHEGRSCLADKLGQTIGSKALTIVDDPTIPRGMGSRPWDGDTFVSKPRSIIENGVLKSYNIGQYFGQKMGSTPTGGTRSNWVMPPGDQPWTELAKAEAKAIVVTGFLGGNSNSTTGDFSYGIQGTLYENGVPVQALSEMNVSGNLLSLLPNLSGVGNDPCVWSAMRVPALVFQDVQFSGT